MDIREGAGEFLFMGWFRLVQGWGKFVGNWYFTVILSLREPLSE